MAKVRVVEPHIGNIRDFDFNEHNWSMSKKGKDWSVSLGNWTDAGWQWSGDKTELASFLIRVANSEIKKEFIESVKEEGIDYKKVKPIILESAKEGSGVYQISGDNGVWYRGTTGERAEEEIRNNLCENLEDEDCNEFIEYFWNKGSTRDAVNFEAYSKSDYYENAKKAIIEIVDEADTWEEMLKTIRDAHDDIMSDTYAYQDEVIMEEIYNKYNEWEECKKQQKDGKKIDCKTGREIE